MNRYFQAFLFLILTTFVTVQVEAQLVNYTFTGTKTQGTAGIGDAVVVFITLDVGAAPDEVIDYTSLGGGQGAIWRNGGFSINGLTSTGHAVGTALGGTTAFQNDDIPSFPANGNVITWSLWNEGHLRMIQLGSTDRMTAGDGVANVPNPWDPTAGVDPNVSGTSFISVRDYDYTTGVAEFGYYTIDVLPPPSLNIFIDGQDTGIRDFVYSGKLVSRYLAEFATDARNHGDYVSAVARFTDALRKADLMTKEDSRVIMGIAVASDIGETQ